jgi:hypothetical protein
MGSPFSNDRELTSASIVQQFIDVRAETQNFSKTAFGHLVMQSADKKLIDRLSQDKRDEMIAIGREALCRFAYAYQHVNSHICCAGSSNSSIRDSASPRLVPATRGQPVSLGLPAARRSKKEILTSQPGQYGGWERGRQVFVRPMAVTTNFLRKEVLVTKMRGTNQ